MKKIIKITIAFLSVFAFLSAGIAETKKTKDGYEFYLKATRNGSEYVVDGARDARDFHSVGDNQLCFQTKKLPLYASSLEGQTADELLFLSRHEQGYG